MVTKITDMTAIGAFASGDLFEVVDDPAGTPLTRKATIDQIVIYVDANASFLANVVEDTTPQLGADLDANTFDILFDDATGIKDDVGNETLLFQSTALATNYAEITNAATGTAVQIGSNGSDANIDLNLTAKGTGVVQADGVEIVTISGTQALTNKSGNISQWTNDSGYITATLTTEQVQDIAGGMVTGNTETLITVTYQDGDGTIDYVVDNDLANYSNTTSAFITASSADALTNKTGAISQWTNDSGYLTGITGENLADLSDVTITAITTGEIIKWSGSAYINNTLAEAGISATGHSHIESDISNLGTAIALVADNLSVFAATTSLQLKGVISDETGSGALVFATSPALVTPALGTPASGVMTNVTGTASGLTAGAVSTITGLAPDTATTAAAQPNITSLGTLTALQVDNLNLNGNTLSSTAGVDLLITPLAGQQIVLDGAIVVDAGVITGATSITSTAFVGALTGNADTVTTNANLTGDVTSSGNATTIASSSVDLSMLSATGTPTGSNFLRGDNTWATPAGSGDMVLADVQTVTGAKTFNVNTLLLDGSTSGAVTFNAPAVAGTTTLTTPGATDTLVGRLSTDTLTNKTINTASNTITVTVSDISDLTNGIEALTTAEVNQLENIGGTTISAADWTAVSNLSGTNSGDEPAASPTVAGVMETATPSEVDTGTDDARAVSPDALAGSNLGIRYMQAVLFDFTVDTATGNGKFYMHIPPGMDGMNLVYVHAEVITAGTTGTIDIQIHNVDNALDMLSTVLTIDSGETGSDTAATPAVINASNDHINTNDMIRVDVDAVSTTAAKGLIITTGYQLP